MGLSRSCSRVRRGPQDSRNPHFAGRGDYVLSWQWRWEHSPPPQGRALPVPAHRGSPVAPSEERHHGARSAPVFLRFAILSYHHISLVRNGRAAPLFFEMARMSNVYDKEKSLYREVAPRVERSLPGVEVLAVELSGPERFTVFIDHPSGVDHALCERVTEVLRDYLDRFSIDVSSPGTDRPLREPRHFERVVGRRVALRTADEIKGRTRFRGEVVAAD